MTSFNSDQDLKRLIFDEQKWGQPRSCDRLSRSGEVNTFAGIQFLGGSPNFLLDFKSSSGSERMAIDIFFKGSLKTVEKEYFCCGFYDPATTIFHPCPLSAPASSGKKFCNQCQEKTGFSPTFYLASRDKLSEIQRSYLLSPHIVYLAYFGAGLLKVGTANTKRMFRRWTDQGALWTTCVAQFDDAWAARTLEVNISKALGVREAYTDGEKRSAMLQDWLAHGGSDALRRARYMLAKECNFTVTNGPIYDLRPVYGLNECDGVLADAEISPFEPLSGVTAVIGSTAVCVVQNDLVLRSLKGWIGRRVINDSTEPKLASVQVQRRLF